MQKKKKKPTPNTATTFQEEPPIKLKPHHENVNEQIEGYTKDLKRYISRERFAHSLEVAKLSKKIAEFYTYENIENAYIAGLLHDVAKDMSFEEHLNLANKYSYKYSLSELDSPATLHAPIGRLLAQHQFGIENPEILLAIAHHTTGRPNMCLLEKIVYLADIVDAGKKVEHALRVKKLVYSDLDAALCLTAKETIRNLLDRDKIICEKSLECYNFYNKLLQERAS